MDVWRLRPSGGTPEQLTHAASRRSISWRRSTRARCSTSRAPRIGRGHGCGRSTSSASVSTRVSASGLDQYTSVSASRDGRRIVATVANPSGEPVEGAAASIGSPTIATPQPYPLPDRPGARWRRASARDRLFYLSARGTGDGLWKVEDGKPSKSGEAPTAPCPSRPRSRRTAAGSSSSCRKRGQAAPDRSCRPTAPTRRRWRRIDRNRRRGRPGHRRLVAGRQVDRHRRARRQGAGAVQDPGRRRRADRGSLDGQCVNPVWSPDGRSDRLRRSSRSSARCELRGGPTGWHARRRCLRSWSGRAAIVSCPNGTGLVYLPRIQSLDFWLLDLATETTRQLTQLDESRRASDVRHHAGRQVTSCSIARGENSDIVLIELPK